MLSHIISDGLSTSLLVKSQLLQSKRKKEREKVREIPPSPSQPSLSAVSQWQAAAAICAVFIRFCCKTVKTGLLKHWFLCQYSRRKTQEKVRRMSTYNALFLLGLSSSGGLSIDLSGTMLCFEAQKWEHICIANTVFQGLP